MIRKVTVALVTALLASATLAGNAAAQSSGDLVAGIDGFTFAAIMIALVALGVVALRRYKMRAKAE